ncbi:MAG: alpha-N-arabinofuranosidase [Chloroflexota bacterium]|nr:alpha-N-arabinofuranosidase [Chloroflexota bacterium]
MPSTRLTVRGDAPIGTISPRLYGHFAEHLGRCCYGGLWDEGGDDGTGFRHEVVAALKALPVPLLRWPGGCYADHYHWRDGIGPPDQRPRRLGMSCGLQVEDDNGLGTHEFLALCADLGAEAYLAGNVGTGSPQEMADWVEYCVSSHDTTLTRERGANGSPTPFSVPLWGVGNENWGCGGNYDAVTYGQEYRRYATMLRHVAPAAELVACGFEDDWNVALLDTLGHHAGLVDHLSIHAYWNDGGPETGFDEAGFDTLLAGARGTEAFIERTAAIVRDAAGDRHRIGIALDEWGVWHPEARPWGTSGVPARKPVTYEQANTLRDALAAAVAFGGFHRHCQVLTLANIAQVVNVLQAVVMTDGPRMWRTATYHAFQMHAAHMGATALPVSTDAGDSLSDGSPAVVGTASTGAGSLTVSLVNQHMRRPAETSLRIEGISTAGTPTAMILTDPDPATQNSAAEPDRLVPVPLPVTPDGPGSWRLDLPPVSLVTVRFANP